MGWSNILDRFCVLANRPQILKSVADQWPSRAPEASSFLRAFGHERTKRVASKSPMDLTWAIKLMQTQTKSCVRWPPHAEPLPSLLSILHSLLPCLNMFYFRQSSQWKTVKFWSS